MNESEVLNKVFSRATSIKKFAKSLDKETVEKSIEIFDNILKIKEEEELALVEIEAQKQSKIEEIKKLMAETGISASDIDRLNIVTRKKVSPKYSIDVDGETHYWSGRGKRPSVFQNYIDAGGDIEELAV